MRIDLSNRVTGQFTRRVVSFLEGVRMPTGLFSTYRQGENRVTSTFLAVLHRIGCRGKILFLSSADKVDIELETCIPNGSPGKAFVQNQRYVSLKALQNSPKNTKELVSQSEF